MHEGRYIGGTCRSIVHHRYVVVLRGEPWTRIFASDSAETWRLGSWKLGQKLPTMLAGTYSGVNCVDSSEAGRLLTALPGKTKNINLMPFCIYHLI